MIKLLVLILSLISKPTETELNPQAVYDYCIEQEILYPEIVTAQAIQEVGWFKCTNCSLDENNIFGFYYKGSYVGFTNWKESVKYYKRWQDAYYNPARDYYDFLACMYKNKKGECIKYAQNPIAYNRDVKSIVKNYSKAWKSK